MAARVDRPRADCSGGAAGKGEAFDDKRHLWPEFFRLIEARKPIVCFGEQVASIDGLAWLDLVQSGLDDAGYACGAVDLCAAGFGAPHRRQRIYWVADSSGIGYDGRRSSDGGSVSNGLGVSESEGLQERNGGLDVSRTNAGSGQPTQYWLGTFFVPIKITLRGAKLVPIDKKQEECIELPEPEHVQWCL